jgi:nitroreductase
MPPELPLVTRRGFVRSTSLGISTILLAGCTSNDSTYANAVASTWRPASVVPANRDALMRELIRCATLAPSSHNTQCWKFRIGERAIRILPDFVRRCPAVDPDDHHLFVSLGCAAENLAQAALANGLRATMQDDPWVSSGFDLQLEPCAAARTPLYAAIPERQSTRGDFDGAALTVDELQLLEHAATGTGVRVLLLTARDATEQILELVTAGNTAQLHDPAFVRELKSWIRFNAADAVRTGDGLFTGTTGNPSTPHWIGNALFSFFLRAGAENEKYAKQVRSSAGIAVFLSEQDDRRHWVETGRCFQRFALQATALGIRTAMINQPVEVPAMRTQFATHLGLQSGRPDLVVRFGRGAVMPRSLRRNVRDVIVGEA